MKTGWRLCQKNNTFDNIIMTLDEIKDDELIYCFMTKE